MPSSRRLLKKSIRVHHGSRSAASKGCGACSNAVSARTWTVCSDPNPRSMHTDVDAAPFWLAIGCLGAASEKRIISIEAGWRKQARLVSRVQVADLLAVTADCRGRADNLWPGWWFLAGVST